MLLGLWGHALAAAQWKPEQYWAFMTRIPKDFTGTQVDTSDRIGMHVLNQILGVTAADCCRLLLIDALTIADWCTHSCCTNQQ